MPDVTDYELVWPPELLAVEAERLLARPPAAVAVGSPLGSPVRLLAPLWLPVAVRLTGVRKTRKQHRLRAFDGAAFRMLSLVVVLASVPSRNNPVMGGVLFTGAAGEMLAGWTSGQSRQSRLRSRWRGYRGSWAMAR